MKIIKNNNPVEDEWLRNEITPHGPEIRRWLCKRFPTIADVDEIIQDGFVKMVDRHRKSPIAHPKPFLFAVCRNLAIDYLRKNKVVIFENLGAHEESAMFSTESEETQNALGDKEQREIMMLAIDQLPRKCRRIFLLRKVEGLPLKEIAKKNGNFTENGGSSNFNRPKKMQKVFRQI